MLDGHHHQGEAGEFLLGRFQKFEPALLGIVVIKQKEIWSEAVDLGGHRAARMRPLHIKILLQRCWQLGLLYRESQINP